MKAAVTFVKYQKIEKEEDMSGLFVIPEDFQMISRKEGMKTLESKKKRMVLANMHCR
jgi:hypothetical protein